MIAVDSNILVYAHRPEARGHAVAAKRLRDLAEARRRWAIPWPCIPDLLNVITHPRIYKPATPLADALAYIDEILASPSLVLLAEAEGHWPTLKEVLRMSGVTGPHVHDARIAAICLSHGVTEFWTSDRDFAAFTGLVVRNPLEVG